MIEFSFTEVDAETKEDLDPQGCDACMYCDLLRQVMNERAAEPPESTEPTGEKVPHRKNHTNAPKPFAKHGSTCA